MDLIGVDIKDICESLHDPEATSITLNNRSFEIKGSPAEENKDQCRSLTIDNVMFMEQKLYKSTKGTLFTDGAKLKRLGYQVVWIVRSDKDGGWLPILNGQVVSQKELKNLVISNSQISY